MDYYFDHQMSLSKSECWYANNCLHFFEVCCSIMPVFPYLGRYAQVELSYLRCVTQSCQGRSSIFAIIFVTNFAKAYN